MMTDPIADMLTRIRNALSNKNAKVRVPYSKLKLQVANVLEREGYIAGCARFPSPPSDGIGPQGWMVLELKYGPEGEQVIESIQRISKPGCRRYSGYEDLKPVLNGLGIEILSTSKGILSSREARSQKVGGELLARIY